jgi:hypothetical protein
MKRAAHSIPVGLRSAVALVAMVCIQACADSEEDRPATYQYDATPTPDKPALANGGCAVASEGCPCDSPGEIRDCGKIVVRVDDYSTCYDASRICTDKGAWSACAADQAVVRMAN